MKTTSRTGKKHYAFDSAPRCGARTKGNNGMPCRCPAVNGKKRCRIHGGARGSGGQQNNQNAVKHGQTALAIKCFKKEIRQALKTSKELIEKLS